jgi:O-antigen/teichoic acid export membrane protein
VAALSSLFPLLSRYNEQDPEAFERTSRLGFRYLSILGVAVPCVLAPLSSHAVTLLFGRPFAPAANPVIVLASTLVFLFGGFLLGSLYVVEGKQKALGLLISIAALLNVVLNWLWIPSHGATGASLATLVSYGFAMIAAACYPPVLAHGRGFLSSLIKPILVGTLSLAVSFKLFADHLPAVSSSFLILYACLLAATGAFRREDWRLARRILSKPPQEET